ncbi:hypothetical protein [Streptomyces sp. MH13]|uniref:hypothetical protein n=1 Tax=Streptomyces sp. MH13 TaxID=3417651 RepID=UPI003CFB7279
MPRAGLLITTFAVGLIVGGPARAMTTLRPPQRHTLIGALAALTLLPLIALALSSTGHRTRIVAQRAAADPVRDDACTPAHH